MWQESYENLCAIIIIFLSSHCLPEFKFASYWSIIKAMLPEACLEFYNALF
jgi:hypothetical protein